MKRAEPGNGAAHQIPLYLRDSSALAVARLTDEGALIEANHGFSRLMKPSLDESSGDATSLFIEPDFETLAGLLHGFDDGQTVFRGILNLGQPGMTPASMKGQVYRERGGLLVVAEHDTEESEHLRSSVLALNETLAETQRKLVRDIHDRKRAERLLEETNRGIVARYAELDKKAQALKRASDLKSRFLSNMTHEFRTPLNAILILSELLLDRADGELSDEQHTQVSFIRSSAVTLSELVNDLLDMAKIEAGRASVHCKAFTINDLFGALRAVLCPLVNSDRVLMTFDDPTGLPTLRTDNGKVSQILRNLIANALKFTEQGQIRIGAKTDGPDCVVISVADTGIGIDPADQERIFEEYAQVEGPLQRRYKGTGLGLPLSRQLAALLGGELSLTSRPGQGSTFLLRLPTVYAGPAAEPATSVSPIGSIMNDALIRNRAKDTVSTGARGNCP